MILSSFYVIFLVFVGILLLVLAYGMFSPSYKKAGQKKPSRQRGKIGDSGVCPVCGTQLVNGAQIKSALFPGKTDRICHIFGCPYCHPFTEESIQRTCPVCHKKVPQEEYLFARLFERPNQKRHVHILGCKNCRLPKKQ